MSVNLDLNAEDSAIWHMLIDSGRTNEEQLTEVYEEQEKTGKSFVSVLYSYEIITEDELLEMIAENLGSQVINIKQVEITPEMIEKISAPIARMYNIIPVVEEDGVLYVAVKDPMNYRLVDELNYVIGQECNILISKPTDIDDLLEKFYPEQAGSVRDVLNEINELEMANIDEDNAEALENAAADAPIVRFVDLVLNEGIKKQASDIHFEPFADSFRVRMRIDGALYETASPPKHLAIPVISRVKVMSNLNISEHRKPQDGRIQKRINGRPIDLRVSTLPTQYGESVVLRVLDRAVVNLDLECLGMPDRVIAGIREYLRRPNGIMVVTGPTGSGKTTTLYSGLKEINKIEDKLLTAEDPVEYEIDGIIQVPVNDAVGMTFAKALRAFLRQDPDRIMIGEIRDLETASMAIQASLTGHLVLSTLHTNDAPGAITRFIDMGIEPFLVSSTICGVLGQRLVRKICSNCRTNYEPNDKELEQLGYTREEIGDQKFYKGSGCDLCNYTGYKGRTGLYELMAMTPALQELINDGNPSTVLMEKAMEEGMVTMRQEGVRKVFTGETTTDEILLYT